MSGGIDMSKSPYREAIDSISDALCVAVSKAGYSVERDDVARSVSLSDRFSDISSTIAMKISKMRSEPADAISDKIIAAMPALPIVRRAYQKGGFINFDIDRAGFSNGVITDIIRNPDSFIRSDTGKGKRVIVEYPSINPVHPLHVGHLRSAILGDMISNILELCGYSVEREDYIDDLGLQAAEALWGLINIRKLGIEFDRNRKYDHMLGDVYVKVNELIKSDPAILDDIKRTSELMEQSGTYESTMLREMVERFISSEYETLSKLGIFHDLLVWESSILRAKLLDKALDMMSSSRITEIPKDGKYAGCIVIDLKRFEGAPEEFREQKETVKVLVRSNGIPGYLSKDIAFHMWKFGIMHDTFMYKEFMRQVNGRPLYTTSDTGSRMDFGNAVISVNTIDSRQSYEQSLIGVVLSGMPGYTDKSLIHIPYGVVELESGALSGRKGTWVGFTADDLINESRSRAESLISSREELGKSERERIAEAVGISAIKFEFSKVSYEKKIVFSWDRALNFEGNSGPYAQYMYTRSLRIIETLRERPTEFRAELLESDVEFALVKRMSEAAEIVAKAGSEYRPNMIVSYLSDISTMFSRFYEAKHVVKAESEDLRDARLAVVRAFNILSCKLLEICGIDRLESM
ncbi:MAG: arginine--tRNA ligase [Candidatus Marsarchaeota archaeon]|nr:arginine--tRNA ligase [Candidatus Marsarchaeota archaeon]